MALCHWDSLAATLKWHDIHSSAVLRVTHTHTFQFSFCVACCVCVCVNPESTESCSSYRGGEELCGLYVTSNTSSHSVVLSPEQLCVHVQTTGNTTPRCSLHTKMEEMGRRQKSGRDVTHDQVLFSLWEQLNRQTNSWSDKTKHLTSTLNVKLCLQSTFRWCFISQDLRPTQTSASSIF